MSTAQIVQIFLLVWGGARCFHSTSMEGKLDRKWFRNTTFFHATSRQLSLPGFQKLTAYTATTLSQPEQWGSTNLKIYGQWQSPLICPEGTFIFGARWKIEDECCCDSGGLTNMEIWCNELEGANGKAVKNEYGLGVWTSWSYCEGPVTSFQIRVFNSDQTSDELATTGLRFKCSPQNSDRISEALSVGQWMDYVGCPEKLLACGLMLQTDDALTSEDYTGVSNVKLGCCNKTIPTFLKSCADGTFIEQSQSISDSQCPWYSFRACKIQYKTGVHGAGFSSLNPKQGEILLNYIIENKLNHLGLVEKKRVVRILEETNHVLTSNSKTKSDCANKFGRQKILMCGEFVYQTDTVFCA